MDSCYLCGKKEIEFIGCYVSNKNDDSVDWLLGKLKKGKTRTFWYGLCGECFNLLDREKLVEDKIESDIKLKRGYSVKFKK